MHARVDGLTHPPAHGPALLCASGSQPEANPARPADNLRLRMPRDRLSHRGINLFQRNHNLMQAKLVVVDGNTKTKEIDLKLPVVLGRGRNVSLKIAHSLVSREHCELFETDGKLMVRDLGSLNGTFIDGQRIDGTAELSSGHLLTVGAVTFRAEYFDAQATHGGAKDETAIGMLPGQLEPAPNPNPTVAHDLDEPVDIDLNIVFEDTENAGDETEFPVQEFPRKKKA